MEGGFFAVTRRPNCVERLESKEEAKASTIDKLDKEDALLKCFSPLLNSMKVFGLYTHGLTVTPIVSRRHVGGICYALQQCIASQTYIRTLVTNTVVCGKSALLEITRSANNIRHYN